MPEPSIVSILPVAITLVIALSVRNVLVGLFAGVLTGVMLITDSGPLLFLPVVVKEHIVPEIADTYNASVLVLLAFIGGFVRLIETSGGGTAFARLAVGWVTSKVRAQVAAWIGGAMIFFSDLGTPLIVGPVFQPLMDRLRVSRQKLAFILDSTSSPVAILIPFIGWGVFIMSVIGDAFSANGIATGEWDAFVAAVPFQFYAWLAISMAPALAVLKIDYGAMAKAEAAIAEVPESADLVADTGGAGPMLVWLPLLVLGVTLFATLSHHGFPFAQVAGSDFRAGLSAAYFLAALTLVVLMLRQRLQTLARIFSNYAAGMSGMMPIAATLVLAWTLGAVSETLGTGPYVAELARAGLPAGLLPAVVFLLAAAISFATGSSWGTIIIVMPLAVPAAVATGAPMAVVVGAVLSGGLFGDHSSPVSETTILSSTGAGTTPLDHFRTQWPYAVTNGLIALAAFVAAGYLHSGWLMFAALCTQWLLLREMRRAGLGSAAPAG